MAFKHLLAALLLLPPAALLAQKPASQPAPPPPPLLSHELHPDRTVTFRFKDAAAAKVELSLEGVAKPIPMAKGPDGIWTYTTQPLAPEHYFYTFRLGDETRLDPENHALVPNMAFSGSNILVVPGDTPQPWDETAVPHGTLHVHRFTSKIALRLPASQEEIGRASCRER